VSKNGSYFELCFPEKKNADDWMKKMKSFCVLENFNEEFKIVKKLEDKGLTQVISL